MKKKVIISSVLTIALCLSLIAGSTLALFTSESNVNVAVTSGTVKVTATAENEQKGSTLGANVPETQINTIENVVTMTNIVAGDYFEFDLRITNESNVTVKFRTVISVVDDNGLWEGLAVTIDGVTYDGAVKVAPWTIWTPADAAQDRLVHVRIELPKDSGNAYQNKTCKFAYTVEAVQGNADVQDDPEGTAYVTNAVEFKAALNAMHGQRASANIVIMNDIDMNGWTSYDGDYKTVTIEGNGHTLNNLAAPLFSSVGIGDVTVSNLNFVNAAIDENYTNWNGADDGHAGVIAGCTNQNGGGIITITNCAVKDSSIKAYKYAGGFIGHVGGDNSATCQQAKIVFDRCTVENTVIQATDSSVGAMIGHDKVNTEIKNCKVLGTTTLECDEDRTNDVAKAGYLIGTVNGYTTTISDCTVASTVTLETNGGSTVANGLVGRNVDGAVVIDNSVYATAAQLKAILTSGTNVTLNHNYILTDAWTSVVVASNTVIDGQGHTISDLTTSLIAANANNLTIKNLTIQDSVIASTSGVGGFNGALISCGNMTGKLTITDCKLLDSTVNGVNDNDQVGGLVGYYAGAVEISGCTVKNCTINGDSSAAGIIALAQLDLNQSISNCTVENCNINSSDDGDWRIGAIVGTVNSSKTMTVTNCTESGNTYAMPNSSATNPGHNLWGRNVDDYGSVIVIDGKAPIASGVVLDVASGIYELSNADGMVWFANKVKADGARNSSYVSAKLVDDIDMSSVTNWAPIGQTGGIDGQPDWYGTFDGDGHTISNFQMDEPTTGVDEFYAVGLFGWHKGTIKNLTMDHADVSGAHNVGAICGYVEGGVIENCKVINSNIRGYHDVDNYDRCGDKVGAIAGFACASTIKDCTVESINLTAGRDAGYIVGCISDGSTVTGCEVIGTNNTMAVDLNCDRHDENMNGEAIGRQA